jgi:16S rRNA processing protein RimM
VLILFDKNNYYCLGAFTKAHGIKGELLLKADFELPEDIEQTELIFIDIDGQLVPFYIYEDGVTIKNDFELIVHIDEVNSVEETRDFIGCSVYLPKDKDYPTDNILSHQDLIGFEVIDVKSGKIGILSDIIKHQANPLLQIAHGLIEILIPLQEDFIRKVDLDKKIIEIEAPEGLIDFYLNNEDIDNSADV